MNYSNLVQLSRECPSIQISITLGELIEAGELLVAEAQRRLEQSITDAHTETYPSRERVMQMLDVSQATLWRWQRAGYLVPINVGGKRRYKMSDIQRILDGGDSRKGGKS